MGIKTVLQPPYCPGLAPCDFWLFPKLGGCRYETIEEMKEAVTKVIDTLSQEDFHGALQTLLEQYNKCIAAEGDYFKGDESFMCVLSIKVPIRKKSGNLFNDARITCHNSGVIVKVLDYDILVSKFKLQLCYYFQIRGHPSSLFNNLWICSDTNMLNKQNERITPL